MTTKNSGSTIIEVAVAMIILAFLALGGAASLHHTHTSIKLQRNKRTAIGKTTERLEELRATTYSDLAPETENYTLYYISKNSDSEWVYNTSDPNETITMNGKTFNITTTLQYIDIDDGSPSYDALKLSASMTYSLTSADKINMETIYSR